MKTLSQFRAHIAHIVKTEGMTIVKIVTRPIYPPIPTTDCDWVAYYDEDDPESRNYGWGPTEQAAIEDLRSSYYPEGAE